MTFICHKEYYIAWAWEVKHERQNLHNKQNVAFKAFILSIIYFHYEFKTSKTCNMKSVR